MFTCYVYYDVYHIHTERTFFTCAGRRVRLNPAFM